MPDWLAGVGSCVEAPVLDDPTARLSYTDIDGCSIRRFSIGFNSTSLDSVEPVNTGEALSYISLLIPLSIYSMHAK